MNIRPCIKLLLVLFLGPLWLIDGTSQYLPRKTDYIQGKQRKNVLLCSNPQSITRGRQELPSSYFCPLYWFTVSPWQELRIFLSFSSLPYREILCSLFTEKGIVFLVAEDILLWFSFFWNCYDKKLRHLFILCLFLGSLILESIWVWVTLCLIPTSTE